METKFNTDRPLGWSDGRSDAEVRKVKRQGNKSLWQKESKKMKKLMLGFAMAAAMVASADVESSNIVGYMDNGSTVSGLNVIGSGFVDIGLTSIKLNELKVANAAGGEVTTGTCAVDLIDENGNTLKSYLWASSGRGTSKTWGWKEGGAAIDDTVVFARGAGMLFTAENAGDTFKSAGEVNLDGLTVSETVAGLNVIANPYPTTVKLNALQVTNSSDGEVTTGTCAIDIIDENGNTLKSYLWASSGRGTSKTWGWKESGSAIDDSVVLTAGQAVLFTAENSGDKLIFPAQK